MSFQMGSFDCTLKWIIVIRISPKFFRFWNMAHHLQNPLTQSFNHQTTQPPVSSGFVFPAHHCLIPNTSHHILIHIPDISVFGSKPQIQNAMHVVCRYCPVAQYHSTIFLLVSLHRVCSGKIVTDITFLLVAFAEYIIQFLFWFINCGWR